MVACATYFTAAGAGICLAVAGLVLQGTLRNPMASPDLLGIGYGAGFGLAIAVLFIGDASGLSKLVVATIGALVVLSAIAGIGWRMAFQPERVLLVGVGGKHVPCSDDPASCQRQSTCSWPPELVFRFHGQYRLE